jgi:Cu(I)/Ag(I) efflux system membrane protein CusA/SilA
VALSGIAIAIGTIVDMGIVVCENILKHLDGAPPGANRRQVIFTAASEVGGAVVTAIATTVVSFLPVFTMEAAEGKLFKPLAYTKTFALLASVVIALTIIPTFAHVLFGRKLSLSSTKKFIPLGLTLAGVVLMFWAFWLTSLGLIVFAAYLRFKDRLPGNVQTILPKAFNYIIVLVVAGFLADHWEPFS